MFPTSLALIGAIVGVVGAHHASALVPDECISSIQHQPVTVTQKDSKYTQTYTAAYTQIGPDGLHKETYTIFETCSSPVCRFPLETALPYGFTTGVVYCETCNDGGPLATTLTFPSASISVYMLTVPGDGSYNDEGPLTTTLTFPSASIPANISGIPDGGLHNSTTTWISSPSTPPIPSPPLTVAAAHISKPPAAIGLAASLLCLLTLAV